MPKSDLQALVNSYEPNGKTLEAIAKLRLLATVGPSASGKTTLMQAAIATSPEMHMVMGETTRPPRKTEQPGVDYIFRDETEVIADLKQGNLIDVVFGPSGGLYCTQPSGYSTQGTNTMALVAAAIETFRNLPFKFFQTVFIVPESFERWQQWLKKQAEVGEWQPQHWHGRLNEAKQSHQIALSDPKMRFVLNDEIEKGAKRLLQLAVGGAPEDETLAKRTAEANYQKLLATT